MVETRTNRYEHLFMYQLNKGVSLDGVEDSWFYRGLRRLYLEYSRARGIRIRPVLSEQIIEYPLFFSYLKEDVKTILDFGCVEGLLPMQLCALGYKVTGLDLRSYPFEHPNFSFIQADILTWEPPQESFDLAVSISTIEHVGLGSYDDPIKSSGDQVCISKLLASVRPGGRLIVTLPVGQPTIRRGMRIYDPERIRSLSSQLEEVKFFRKDGRYGHWLPASEDSVRDLIYDRYEAMAPVQATAFCIFHKRDQ